jgi:uncharacterized membrane protein YphA (DoxX/SURF4 family)
VVVDFLKIFGVVLLFGGGLCTAQGMIPQPIAAVGAFALLGLAIYHHRNRSLL